MMVHHIIYSNHYDITAAWNSRKRCTMNGRNQNYLFLIRWGADKDSEILTEPSIELLFYESL